MNKKRKTKRRAVRDILGRVDHYTNTKTVGLRDPVTGKIVKRIPKEKAMQRGPVARIYTVWDEIEDSKRKRKRKKSIFDW